MKTFYIILLSVILSLVTTFASDDPVSDFLRSPVSYLRDPGYYASDKVLRLDLDLRGDGQIETLLTLNRDRDGKQGNIWKVYKKAADNYQYVGSMTFNPARFYSGRIDALGGKYGLVTFGPSGAGAGIVTAYLYNASGIQETDVSKVTGGIDPVTGDREENKALKKYFHDKVIQGDSLIKEISAKDLADKYGIKIEKNSFKDALHNGFKGVQTGQ